MPYVAMARYQHGHELTAARLNTMSGNIAFLYGFIRSANFGVQSIGNRGGWQNYFVVHKFRWLWFSGTGTMNDFTGGNVTDLNSGDLWAAGLDLQSLPWLHYGDHYRITGVSWALETQDA